MGFTFEREKIYEMPVFFGPSPEPKNPGPGGTDVRLKKPGDVEAVTVIFETDTAPLEALLPQGFSLVEPVLSVAVCEFGNLGHFAGHTYYLINISVPVRFDGERDHLRGDLVLAMYENHADPILGGRDLLGYSKIYADIPRFVKDTHTITAQASNWDFKFLDVSLDMDAACPDADAIMRLAAESEGKFNYKYVQSVPEKGQHPWQAGTDASYPVFNPKAWTAPEGYPFTLRKPETRFCAGTVRFHRPGPQDIPMGRHIVGYLADLPIRRYLGASHTIYNDPCDYSHTYRLR